jgi:HAMP domain-containing protein
MSIRLRLTLLYTAILALTLIAFGGVLYGTQAQTTRGREEFLLSSTAQRIIEYRLSDDAELDENPFFPKPPRGGGGPPEWQKSSPRNYLYVQILTPTGDVIAALEDLEEDTTILSEAGLQAALRGEIWEGSVWIEDEHFLVYSAPVVIEDQVKEIVQIARPLTEQDRHLDALARNLLIVGGVAVLAAFGIGWILSGLALRPVNRITQTAHAIGTEQDLSRRVDHTGPNDEIGRLASTFNEMTER